MRYGLFRKTKQPIPEAKAISDIFSEKYVLMLKLLHAIVRLILKRKKYETIKNIIDSVCCVDVVNIMH